MNGTTVSIRSADRVFDGYLAVPTAPGRHPGLVVVHEVFGVTPWIRSVAERLASKGFAVLAPDLFVGRIHARFTPDTAMRVMPLVWQLPVEVRIVPDALRKALKGHREDDIEIALGLTALGSTMESLAAFLDDLRAAVALLRARHECSGKVGALGFCFGGRAVFHLAAVEPTLNAAVVFYGSGPRESEVENIRCPVLGLYGEDDEQITKDVPRVDRAMARYGKAFEHEIYNRTGHAFAREGSAGYKEASAKAAWERAEAFLDRHLRAT